MNNKKQKQISIRFPVPLWRRLKALDIDDKIESIQAMALAAIEKEVEKIEQDKEAKID